VLDQRPDELLAEPVKPIAAAGWPLRHLAPLLAPEMAATAAIPPTSRIAFHGGPRPCPQCGTNETDVQKLAPTAQARQIE
jgi:hypothetical protein